MSSRASRWSSYRVAGSGWLQAALSLELSKEHLVKGTDLKTELLRRCVPRKSLGRCLPLRLLLLMLMWCSLQVCSAVDLRKSSEYSSWIQCFGSVYFIFVEVQL